MVIYSDLEISRRQLEMFLDEYDVVPYKVLNFLTSYINYGGRVTDDKDLRTIDVILKVCVCARVAIVCCYCIALRCFFCCASRMLPAPVSDVLCYDVLCCDLLSVVQL